MAIEQESEESENLDRFADVDLLSMPRDYSFLTRVDKLEAEQKNQGRKLDGLRISVNQIDAKLNKPEKLYLQKPENRATLIALTVSILALLLNTWTTFHAQRSTDHRLKGVEDGLAILAIPQGPAVQRAIHDATQARVQLPSSELEHAQKVSSVLVAYASSDAATWQTVASVVDYRSAGFSVDHPDIKCFPSKLPHGGGASIDAYSMQTWLSIPGLKYINIGCAIDLDKASKDPSYTKAQALVFANVDVYYSGAPLTDKRYIFYHCRFHLQPQAPPTPEGQELMKELLVADMEQPIEFSPTQKS